MRRADACVRHGADAQRGGALHLLGEAGGGALPLGGIGRGHAQHVGGVDDDVVMMSVEQSARYAAWRPRNTVRNSKPAALAFDTYTGPFPLAEFNRIIQSRALRVAGVALGTVALTGAAALSSGLGQAVSVALGASGLGALAKEYGEFKSELGQLKESPGYFVWHLGRVSQSK